MSLGIGIDFGATNSAAAAIISINWCSASCCFQCWV